MEAKALNRSQEKPVSPEKPPMVKIEIREVPSSEKMLKEKSPVDFATQSADGSDTDDN